MVSGIRSETTVSMSLANVYLWLARNRGQEIDAYGHEPATPSSDVTLLVGVPITAPRAVICTIWLLDKVSRKPLLAGRLCGLINPRDGSVKLRFDGSAGTTAEGTVPPSRESVMVEGARLASELLALVAAASEREGQERLIA